MVGLEWELVAEALGRVSLDAARAVAPLRGCGDERRIDQAAVDAMRAAFALAPIDGLVVLGEGEKDQAPLLAPGEIVGRGDGPSVDIVVDPIDGTRAVSADAAGALTAVGACARGRMWSPGRGAYVDKLAVGPKAAGHIDLARPLGENVDAIARACGRPVSEVIVGVLDRPRNRAHVDAIRASGARALLLPHADLAAAIALALPGRVVDAVAGIGGTAEAVLAACALACVGGDLQLRAFFRDDAERASALVRGLTEDQVLSLAELVDLQQVAFAAAGVTESSALRASRARRVQWLTLAPGHRRIAWS